MTKKMSKCECGRIIGEKGSYHYLLCGGCISELRSIGWTLKTVIKKYREQHEGAEVSKEIIDKWKV